MGDDLNEWLVQSGFLNYQKNQLRCLRMGHGKKVLVAFHGFGQNASVFEPLAKLLDKDYTIVAIDFPGNSESLWKSKGKPNCKIISYFIQRICADFGAETISLLGYSMGGRLALCLTGYLPEKVERLILLAPDGLNHNIWYYLATHSFYGSLLFKTILKKPEKWIHRVDKWVDRGWVQERWQKIVHNTLNNPDYRAQALIAWPFTRNFIPKQKFIRREIKKKNIPVQLFMGARDKAFPPEEGRNFVTELPSAQLHVLNCGHHILEEDNLSEIVSVLKKALI